MKLCLSWSQLPPGIRKHLTERLADRSISQSDLTRLDMWIRTNPDVPEGKWFKDFGSFKIGGEGPYIKTFLSVEMGAYGIEIK